MVRWKKIWGVIHPKKIMSNLAGLMRIVGSHSRWGSTSRFTVIRIKVVDNSAYIFGPPMIVWHFDPNYASPFIC